MPRYPVVAANDASLVALAESTFGAGRDVTDLIYINGGASGIGGGVISGGVSLVGIAGYAGEFGHTLVNSAGVICSCGLAAAWRPRWRELHFSSSSG
jgi:predicted NBD/HSP70 family sugar kinase